MSILMSKRVLIFGTFDGLHSGHLFMLRTARTFGDVLIVGVARDAHVRELKQKEPELDEQQRMEAVSRLGYVDTAVLCDEQLGSFGILDDVRPDLIVLGHDQQDLEAALRRWMESNRQISITHAQEISVDTCANCTC